MVKRKVGESRYLDESSFMTKSFEPCGKVATGLHQQADVVLFQDAEFAFRLLDEFR